jgi:tRNA(Ser,Leu) C12 N-acetylase TAN1
MITQRVYLGSTAPLKFHNLISEVVNFKTFLKTKNANICFNNINFVIRKVIPEPSSFGIEEIKMDNKVFSVAEFECSVFDTFLNLKIHQKQSIKFALTFALNKNCEK